MFFSKKKTKKTKGKKTIFSCEKKKGGWDFVNSVKRLTLTSLVNQWNAKCKDVPNLKKPKKYFVDKIFLVEHLKLFGRNGNNILGTK